MLVLERNMYGGGNVCVFFSTAAAVGYRVARLCCVYSCGEAHIYIRAEAAARRGSFWNEVGCHDACV